MRQENLVDKSQFCKNKKKNLVKFRNRNVSSNSTLIHIEQLLMVGQSVTDQLSRTGNLQVIYNTRKRLAQGSSAVCLLQIIYNTRKRLA